MTNASEGKRNPVEGRLLKIVMVLFMAAAVLVFLTSRSDARWADGEPRGNFSTESERQTDANAQRMLEEGKRTFRFGTFGDEAFWSDALQLQRALAGEKLGGVGPGVNPKTALAVGLKVDVDALPASLISQLKHGRVNLDDPATTLALLKLNAVVGVKGTFSNDGSLHSVGITCALCHSTVDDSLAPGIGRRLDGWANRDLNVGAIAALSPNLKPVADLLNVDEATVRAVLQVGDQGSSTRSCSSTVRLFDRTASRPRRSYRRRLVSRVSTFTRGQAGVQSRIGTLSSPIWRCTGKGPFTIRV